MSVDSREYRERRTFELFVIFVCFCSISLSSPIRTELFPEQKETKGTKQKTGRDKHVAGIDVLAGHRDVLEIEGRLDIRLVVIVTAI